MMKKNNTCLGDPTSVYVHIPFCRHRCGYCNFTLVSGRDYLIESYLDAIEQEIVDRTKEFSKPIATETIFLGGGTPTHLNGTQLRRLFAIINEHFDFNELTEFSTEANPQDIDCEKVKLLASEGINRISLGVQSFDSGKLKLLERDHDEKQVRLATELSRDSFRSLSIDLIFGFA